MDGSTVEREKILISHSIRQSRRYDKKGQQPSDLFFDGEKNKAFRLKTVPNNTKKEQISITLLLISYV